MHVHWHIFSYTGMHVQARQALHFQNCTREKKQAIRKTNSAETGGRSTEIPPVASFPDLRSRTFLPSGRPDAVPFPSALLPSGIAGRCAFFWFSFSRVLRRPPLPLDARWRRLEADLGLWASITCCIRGVMIVSFGGSSGMVVVAETVGPRDISSSSASISFSSCS